MHKIFPLILLLGACTRYEGEIREVGEQVFTEKEAASGLAIDASIRYLCRTARIGPMLDRLNTEEKVGAWEALCQNSPQLPGE